MLKEENKRLKIEKNHDEVREENKKLKLEKEHKTALSKFTRGQYLQSELLMNTVMKMDRSGIGYLANQEKKAQAQHQQQHKSKPKPKRCVECGQGHFAHECQNPPAQPSCSTATCYCPPMTTSRRILVMRLSHLSLPPPVIISSGSHLCK